MFFIRAIGNNLTASAISLFCALVFAPIFLRILGAEQFGIFGVAQILIGTYSMLELGAGAFVVRELAKSLSSLDGGIEEARLVVKFGISFCIVSSGVAALLVIWTALFMLSFWSPEFQNALSEIMHLIAALVFLSIVQVFLASLLSGYKLQNVAAWFGACSWVLRLVIGWFWLSSVQPSTGTLLESQIFAVTLVVLAQVLFVWDLLRKKGVMFKFSTMLVDTRTVWNSYIKFSVHYFPATLLGFLTSNLDRILLMRILGAVEYGCFTVAKNLVSGMFAVSQVITSYAYPVFAASLGDRYRLAQFYFGLQLMLGLLLVPSVLVLLTATEFLMNFYSGDAVLTEIIIWYLAFLIIGFVFSMTGALAQTLLVASGRERSYLLSVFLALACVLLGWGWFEVTGSLRDFLLISAVSSAMSSLLSLHVVGKNLLTGLMIRLLVSGWLFPWVLGMSILILFPNELSKSWAGVVLILMAGLISVWLPNYFSNEVWNRRRE